MKQPKHSTFRLHSLLSQIRNRLKNKRRYIWLRLELDSEMFTNLSYQQLTNSLEKLNQQIEICKAAIETNSNRAFYSYNLMHLTAARWYKELIKGEIKRRAELLPKKYIQNLMELIENKDIKPTTE